MNNGKRRTRLAWPVRGLWAWRANWTGRKPEPCATCGGGGVVYWTQDVEMIGPDGEDWGGIEQCQDYCPDCDAGKRLWIIDQTHMFNDLLRLMKGANR
jgi:hypothetical protein